MENYLKSITIAVLRQPIRPLFLCALMSITHTINPVGRLDSAQEACLKKSFTTSTKTGPRLGYIWLKCSLQWRYLLYSSRFYFFMYFYQFKLCTIGWMMRGSSFSWLFSFAYFSWLAKSYPIVYSFRLIATARMHIHHTKIPASSPPI